MWPFRKKPSPPITMSDAWEGYLAAGEREKEDFRTLFRTGAASEEIQELEKLIGCALPDDYRVLLGANDGQVPETGFGLPGWEFYSVERVCSEWKVWADLRETQFVPEGYSCNPSSNAIRADEWWRSAWLPFCGDGGGNHLCLDLEPTKFGTVGQVITMWHDDGDRALVAPSLKDFVLTITHDLQRSLLVWNEEWGGIYEPFDDV